MKTNQLHIETSIRTLEELERAAYMAGDIIQAELYGNMIDAPVAERIKELTDDLKDADEIIEGLRQELDELKRVVYQFANLDPKNNIEILRAIQRAGAVL
jgi:molybdopterin converting factor small subunit